MSNETPREQAAGPEVPREVQRADQAYRALDAYMGQAVDAAPGAPATYETETAVTDLVADLMHYADFAGLDWPALLTYAEHHYIAEKPPHDGSPECPDACGHN